MGPSFHLGGTVKAVGKHLIGFAVVASIAAAGKALSFNQTTIALAMLLGVLYEATVWGLAAAISTSVAAVLMFNFFFLPPVGTFTIQDPQNWIALFAFLVTAVTASQLSARAQRRTAEAVAQRSQAEQLYAFGRAMLVNEHVERTVQAGVADLVRIFALESAAFTGSETFSGETTLAATEPASEIFHDVIREARPMGGAGWRVVPVRMGVNVIGSLGIKGAEGMNEHTLESVANLLAIALERKYALLRAAQLETARQGEQLRAALLDGLAHDLKTPLTAIKASATALLAHQARLDGTTAEYVSIINEESDRLHIAVSEAIETARVGAHALEVKRTATNVGQLVHDLVHERTRYSEQTRVTPERFDVEVPLDRDLMRLALRQLIDNAVKYSPADKRVEVSLENLPDQVLLQVADRGPGLDSDDRAKVFDKFYRGSAGRQVAGGSGMGLFVAKTIIEAHRGSISASGREGGGAVFQVSLPKSESA